MKKTILFIAIFLLSHTIQAQTFAEWFQQNKTQKKYLAEQIVALQAYATVLKKGYDVANKGLTAIGNIKNGDFGLHAAYFNSLKAVNPAISKYPRVSDIYTLQQNIQDVVSNSKAKALHGNLFSAGERDYINGVYTRLSSDCLSTLNELEAVTTPGKLEMKDDERIRRIDRLYADSQNQYGFAKQFSNDLLLMQDGKQKGQNDIQSMLSLYNLQ